MFKRIVLIRFWIALLCFATVAPAYGQNEQSARRQSEPDWLRFVPGDARFYIELHDLISLRRQFQRLGIWEVVRELAEGERPAETRLTASRPATPLPGLDAEQAISLLIGRRAALFSESSSQWQNGVLLAELERPTDLHRWRVRWGARRLEDVGPVQCYLLDSGLRMAVLDRTLVLGPAQDATNLWSRTVALMSGGPGSHLRGRSEFAALAARMKSRVDGLAYVAWNPGDPFAIAGCERMLVGFSMSQSAMKFEVHGQRPGAEGMLAPCDREVLSRLPLRTIAAWCGNVNPASLKAEAETSLIGREGSPFASALKLLDSLQADAGRFLDQLGPGVVVCLMPDTPNWASTDLQMPMTAVLLESSALDSVLDRTGSIMEFVATAARLVAATPDAPARPILRSTRRVGGIEVHSVPLGESLARRFDLPFLGKIEPCWAAVEGRLAVASSPQQMGSILAALNKEQTSLNDEFNFDEIFDSAEGRSPPVQWAFLRGTMVSQMLRNWLGYIRLNHPDAMNDDWWQTWALERARQRTRFGVALRGSASHSGGAEVIEVDSVSPAADLLQVGDVIVAVDGKALPSANPAMEAARRYNERGRSTAFRLTVLRDHQRVNLSVPVEPLPGADLQRLEPIRALRRLIVLLRRVEHMTYVRRGLSAERLHVNIAIEWK